MLPEFRRSLQVIRPGESQPSDPPESVRRPDAASKFVPRNNLPGILEQNLQDLDRLLLQLDLDTVLAQLRALQIELEDTELQSLSTGWVVCYGGQGHGLKPTRRQRT